jgi:hypothetical protein
VAFRNCVVLIGVISVFTFQVLGDIGHAHSTTASGSVVDLHGFVDARHTLVMYVL